MIPIAQETIDFADDFFFRLSQKQVREKLSDYHKRQPDLAIFMLVCIDLLSGKKQADILFRMILILDYCFTYSYPKLRPVTDKVLIAHLQWQEVANENAFKKLGSVYDEDFLDLIAAIGNLNQDALMNYFDKKIDSYYVNEPIFTEKDNDRFSKNIMAYAFLYQMELQKQLNEKN